jgi:GGDEF domain-containing protein
MQTEILNSKNIIHSRCIIDADYCVISADEEFYRFIGPTIRVLSDAIHQVDMDDFLYVAERLEPFKDKSMILRIKRFDNTFRWCLVTLSKDNDSSVNHIDIGISDIINLDNHYMALTKVFDTKKKRYDYNSLKSSDEVLELARTEIDEIGENQIHLILVQLEGYNEILEHCGSKMTNDIMTDITTELIEYVGGRGVVSKYGDSGFLLMLRNLGNESNVRSFIESSRTRIRWMFASREDALNIDFTIATAEKPRNGVHYDAIVKKLFKAFEIAKAKGGHRYIIYKEELHGEI